MRLRLRALFAVAGFAIAAGAAAGCSSDIDSAPERVFASPPWTADESMTYDLVEQGGQVYGQCEVTTDVENEPRKTLLSFLCADGDGNRDDRTALVDSNTLQPLSATREIVKSDGKRTTFASEYDPPVVKLTATEDSKERTAERDLPVATDDNPDPGWYDDESLLWLVRGIPLREGFKGAFKDVNASTGRVFTVEATVEGKEPVSVPAGDFTAWKIRIRTSSVTHYFWVDVEAPHRIIRARVEHLSYELTGVQ